MSVVLRFQSTGIVPGDGQPVTMVGNSMTIGRGKENDVVLPDPDRVVSSRHCAIEDQNGNVVVVDLSTNGTFLNYSKIPLGPVPTPLNDGDILCIGGFELVVGIRAQPAPGALDNLPPPSDQPSVAPSSSARTLDDPLSVLEGAGGETDFLDDLLGEPKAPVGPSGVERPELGDDGLLPPLGDDDMDLLAPAPASKEEMGASQSAHNPSVQDQMPLPRTSANAIPDDWDLDLGPADAAVPSQGNPFDEPETPAAADMGGAAFIPEDDDLGFLPVGPEAEQIKQAVARVQEQPAPIATQTVTPAAESGSLVATPVPIPAGTTSSSADQAADVLLEAAGVGDLQIPPEEIPAAIGRIGNVLRIMIHGLREILMTRTSIKSEFRINQTMIGATGNNPLKFSITPEQAVEVMVRAPARGYLSAEDAAEQALQDIKAHEVAVMTGMEAALKGVLQKLSPEVLEGQITQTGGLGGMLKGKKARYWETYERIYADVADQAENEFHELFSREFARAYQDQLERLKKSE